MMSDLENSLQINLPAGVRRASPNDWKQLADITADAFQNDPVNRWIFGNPRAITSAFRILARDIYAKRGICHLAGDGGASMWIDSSANNDLGRWATIRFIASLTLYGSKGAASRAMAAGQIMEHNHPREPHLYLFTIGTRQSARGTGLGKALLAPVLDACDRDGVACYLENSNPANHSYYAMHGFERMKVFACGEGGPPLEAMWRAPATQPKA